MATEASYQIENATLIVHARIRRERHVPGPKAKSWAATAAAAAPAESIPFGHIDCDEKETNMSEQYMDFQRNICEHDSMHTCRFLSVHSFERPFCFCNINVYIVGNWVCSTIYRDFIRFGYKLHLIAFVILMHSGIIERYLCVCKEYGSLYDRSIYTRERTKLSSNYSHFCIHSDQ